MSEVSTMSDIVTLHAGRVLLHMKHALFVLYVALFLGFFLVLRQAWAKTFKSSIDFARLSTETSLV